MSELGPRLRLLQDLTHGDTVAAVFLAHVLDRGLTELRIDHWPTAERALPDLGPPLFRWAGPERVESAVVESEGALVHVELQGGFVSARAAAGDGDTALAAIALLRGLLPTPEPVARHDVPVAFWTYTPNGPMPSL